MIQLSRRTFVAAVPVAALAACAGQTAAQVTQAALTYAADIANSIALAATAVQNVKNLPSTVPLAKIIAAAKDASDAAASLSTTMSENAAQPIAMQIQGDLQTVIATARPYVPANVQGYLDDASVVLPLLFAAIGMFSAAKAPLGAESAAARLHAAPRAR